MGWLKACQAGWQIRAFLQRREAKERPPISGGLVFFEEFTGRDWKAKGWEYWYAGHSNIDGYRVDLLRLKDGKLETFPESR